MRYSYQAEKLSSARASLMLPHTRGEAESIASAFFELSLAFHQLDTSQLADSPQRWARKLLAYMDTSGIPDPNGEGAWAAKARTFTSHDQMEISHAVDELASWFDSESGI